MIILKKTLMVLLIFIVVLVCVIPPTQISKVYAENESIAFSKKITECKQIAKMINNYCIKFNIHANISRRDIENKVYIYNLNSGGSEIITNFIKENNIDEECVVFNFCDIGTGLWRFDVNNDEMINICDCVKYVYILLIEYDKYMNDGYDYNKDGKKDIFDVEFLINIILGEEYPPIYT